MRKVIIGILEPNKLLDKMKISYRCLVLQCRYGLHTNYEVQILEKNDTCILHKKGIGHKLENSFGPFLLTS